MKNKLYFLFCTSIFKTIVFNVKYFGFKALFRPRVLISKNVKLKKLKGKVSISQDAKKCHVGYSTNYIFMGKPTKTTFYNEGSIIINGNLCISKGCSIVVKKQGELTFGNDVHISQNTQIECHCSIEFKDEVMVSWDCLIIDSDTHAIMNLLNGQLLNSNKPITFEKGSWVCARSIVLKGALLGESSILSAGSTLTKQMPEKNSVIVNNKVVKTGVKLNMKEEIA